MPLQLCSLKKTQVLYFPNLQFLSMQGFVLPPPLLPSPPPSEVFLPFLPFLQGCGTHTVPSCGLHTRTASSTNGLTDTPLGPALGERESERMFSEAQISAYLGREPGFNSGTTDILNQIILCQRTHPRLSGRIPGLHLR